MSHLQAEVFWQIPHCQDWQDDKFLTNPQGGMGKLGIDWAIITILCIVMIMLYILSLLTYSIDIIVAAITD